MQLLNTKDMPRMEWLRARQHGLGGSDVAACLGLCPYKSPLELWQDKKAEEIKELSAEHIYWGSTMEDMVAKEFSKRFGVKVQRLNFMCLHDELPLFANIDRLVWEDGKLPFLRGEFRTKTILECKTANSFAQSDYGPEGTDEIPENYFLQSQHNMGTCGAMLCFVPVLFGGQKFKTYLVKRDQDLINRLQEFCAAWWERHVVADVPPAPRTKEETQLLFSKSAKKTVFGTSESLEAAKKAASLKDAIKTMKKDLSDLEMKLMTKMEDAEILKDEDGKAILATWKTQKRSKVDNVGLYEEFGITKQDVARHTTQTESRTFLLKGPKA